ncbi:hypothetical protein QTP86_001008 [Hemibagrus guttatus]|nr:hypothetical protein QTP86_001008 [Hemibagrus guttatus]
MKSGKAVGPDDIPVEVWKCLGEAAVEFLTSLFNRVLENLEKAYDRVPREELWYCMRKSGVAEKYVRVVQDMYERSRTVVRCVVGQTEEFKVEVGLHQGSALSPFLFAIVMDQLSEEVRQESPWTMMFADDIVICSESREQVEENLERWGFALERRGIKVSRSKTESMCVNESEGSGTVRLQGEEVKKVQEFKYLGSTVQSNGECGKEWRWMHRICVPSQRNGNPGKLLPCALFSRKLTPDKSNYDKSRLSQVTSSVHNKPEPSPPIPPLDIKGALGYIVHSLLDSQSKCFNTTYHA